MEQFYQVLAWIALFAYWLMVASVTLRIVFKRRAIGVSLAWLMIIYILPIVGVICYLLFGELNLGSKRATRSKEMIPPFAEWFKQLNTCAVHKPERMSFHARPIHQLCLNRTEIPSLTNNQLTLKQTPEDIIRSMIADIQQATTAVHLEFYIWHHGGLADDMAAALIQASKRGVNVKLLLDGAGSRQFLNSHWPEIMRKSGIQLIEALSVSPFRAFFRRLDLRLHRKIVVIDNHIAYTGSMNMVDPRFFKQDANVGQWVDIMVRLTGPTVSALNCIQAWDWEVETGERAFPPLPDCSKPIIQNKNDDADSTIQVIPSGPGMPEGMIQQVLLLAIHQARESLVITTPYFIPSEQLLLALTTSAQRGVQVDIIVPDKNDSLMVEWASRSFFTELFEAGVNIHRFKGGLLHTKSVVIDNEFCLVGTVNLDMRSLWLNFEVTLAIDEPEFCHQFTQLQHQYLKQSEQVDPRTWQQRALINKPVEQFFYLFAPLL
ncbi:cardiolipin synthase [Vibrio sp. SS-MA-C1-2]|uniref:cardiolipin synthase n=1 Tax=Vibrio sp. SS-MA-C1-2 TaxID=2908646 RepID=UPI001F23F15E|nr:cardiolipin synthase [Vibrio sp. SS-MA-C1-2]UJF19928.1 cardiolipin synthase [Vibrio sp. SS-MA-C1-2]